MDCILQTHAPIKKRYVQAIQASFVNNKMHKETTKKLHLRNKFMDCKTDAEGIPYNKQGNHCFNPIRNEEMPVTLILKYAT